jgi:hypothetical protein
MLTFLQRLSLWLGRLLLVVLLLLALALVIVPQLPVVRNRVLGIAQDAAQEAGVSFDYDSSGGHLLTGLRVNGIRANAPGVDAAVGSVRVGYNLLGLLRREVPLSVQVDTLQGDIDVEALQAFIDSQPPRDDAGGGLPVTPVLRDVQIDGVSLNINDIPFDVPDVALESLDIQEDDAGNLQVVTALSSSEGRAELAANVQLEPLIINADITRLDARLARPFFDGIEAGTLTGEVRVAGDDVQADLQLVRGRVNVPVGANMLELTNIAGPVNFADNRAALTLSADALGGQLDVVGSADLTQEQWQAEATLGADLARVSTLLNLADALTGDVDIQATASGWEDFQATANLLASGSAFAVPLEQLSADATFDSITGLLASVRGTLAGAQLQADVAPVAGGLGGTAAVILEGFSNPAISNLTGRIDANFEQTDGLLAQVSGVLSGAAAGRVFDVSLAADANQTDALNVNATVQASTNQGETVNGDVTLTGEVLETTINVDALQVPGLLTPINAQISAAGGLADLPFNVQLANVNLPSINQDFGGNISGRWQTSGQPGTVRDLDAQLGTLSLSGTVSPSDGGELSYALAPTSLAAPLAGTVAVSNGQLTLTNNANGTRIITNASVQTQNINTGAVALSDISANLSATIADALNVTLQDERAGIDARVQGEQVRLELADYLLTLSGEPLRASGTVTTMLDDPSDALITDLLLTSRQPDDATSAPQLRAQVRGSASDLNLDVSADAGVSLAGQTLAQSVTLAGTADLAPLTADLQGYLGGVRTDVNVQQTDAGLVVNSRFDNLGETFNVTVTVPPAGGVNLATSGELSVEALARVLDLPLAGQVSGDLAYGANGYDGMLNVTLDAANQSVNVSLQGQGEALQLFAQSDLAGNTITVDGRVTGVPTSPQLDATAQLADFGQVRVSGTPNALQLAGSGTVPGVSAVNLEPLPWQLSGNLQDGINVSAGTSTARITPAASGYNVTANVQETLQLQNLRVTPNITTNLNSRDLASGTLSGNITVSSPNQTTTLPVSGTFASLQLGGSIPAPLLAEGLGVDVSALGRTEALELSLFANALEPSYRALIDWEDVQVVAEGDASNLTARLAADGLAGQFVRTETSNNAFIDADAVSLADLLPGLPVEAVLDGRLEYDLKVRRYQGDLNVAVTSPVTADVQLSGDGSQLQLDANAAQGEAVFDVAGVLLPRLRLDILATVGESQDLLTAAPVRFDAMVLGSLSAPQLDGTLTTAAFSRADPVAISVPAQRVTVRAGVDDSVTGEGAPYGELANFTDSIRLENGQWSGSLAVPFDLADLPHALRLGLTGALASPNMGLLLEGDVISGDVSTDTQTADVAITVNPNALGLMPETVMVRPLTLTANANLADTTYRATIQTAGQVSAGDTPLPFAVDVTATGQAATYNVNGTATVAGEPLLLTASGNAADVRVVLDLDELDLAAFSALTDIAGVADGQIIVTNSASNSATNSATNGATNGETGVQLDVDVLARGSASGQPFDITALANLADGITLSGDVAGTQVNVQGPLAAAGQFDVRASGEVFALDADVNVADTITLTGTGQVQGDVLELSASFTPSSQRGQVQASLAGAAINGQLEPTAAGLRAVVDANAPAGSVVAPDVMARATVSIAEGVVLDSLTVNSAALELIASASGTITPLNVQGTVTSQQFPDGVQTLNLTARTEAGETQVQVNVADTVVTARIADAITVTTAGLLELADFGVLLENGLGYQRGSGFTGQTTVTVTPSDDLLATLVLVGAGDLNVTGEVTFAGENIVNLNVMTGARPWEAGATLAGDIAVDVPVGAFAPVGVFGTLALAGEVTRPQVSGDVRVLAPAGTLAVGTLEASTDGATLNLSGEGLDLRGTATTKGFNAQLDARRFDLSPFVSQLQNPTLNGQLRAEQTWGDALVADADLHVAAERSRVGVVLVPTARGFDVVADVDVDARDITVSDVRGRVAGQVQMSPTSLSGEAFTSTPIAGELTLRDVAQAAADWSLSGTARVSGTANNPVASVDLNGQGSASGQLNASFDSRGLRVTSNLAVAGAETDVLVAIAPDGQVNDARGRVRFAEYVLALEDTSATTLRLSGQEALENWLALIDIPAQTVSLSGNLATVAPAEGDVDVRVAAQADSWLTGTLTGLASNGVSVGDITLTGTGGVGGDVTLAGENVQASASLGDLTWNVERLALALPAALNLVLQGQGQAADAELFGTLTGDVAGDALNVPLELRYQDGNARVVVQSEDVLGGQVDITAGLTGDALTGNITLNNLTVAGTNITANGTLGGTTAAPVADLNLDVLQGENDISAVLTFREGVLELDSRIASALLAEPLSVSGQALPTVDVRLSQAEETLQLGFAQGRLRGQGTLSLELAGVNLVLEGTPSANSSLSVLVDASGVAPGLALQTRLPDQLDQLDSLTIVGVQETSGSLRVNISERVVLFDDVAWQDESNAIRLNGELRQAEEGFAGRLEGMYQLLEVEAVTEGIEVNPDALADAVADEVDAIAPAPGEQVILPWLAEAEQVGFVLQLAGQTIDLNLASDFGDVLAQVSLSPLTATVQGDLQLADGSAQIDLRYDETGPNGSIVLANVPLVVAYPEVDPDDPEADVDETVDGDGEPLTSLAISSNVQVSPAGVNADGQIDVFGGLVGVRGQAGWARVLPAGLVASYFPESGNALQGDILLDGFDPQVVPLVAARLPNLNAPISGAVSVRDNVLLGQIVSPDLAILDSDLPLSLELSGTLAEANVQGSLGRNRINVSTSETGVSGRVNLLQFPLHALAEAAAGDLDLDARTTAAIRFELPANGSGLFVDLATERLRLQQGNAVSTGDVSLTYQDGALVISRARFDSENGTGGFWQAQGSVAPDLLDVSLLAQDADFTPILRLVPALAASELQVQGSLELRTSGDLAEPTVNLTSPLVTLGLGDSTYRIEDTDVSLIAGRLDANSRVVAGFPLDGTLIITGDGNLADTITVRIAGDLEVPPLGLVEDINLTIVPTEEGVPLDGSVQLGNPLTVAGTLVPVSLAVEGNDLDLRAPTFTLASSITNIDVDINQTTRSELDPPQDPAGETVYVISGQVLTEQAQLATSPPDPDAPVTEPDPDAPTNPFLQQIIFDDLRIFAQRMTFQQSVISAEASADLTLSGTAGTPLLDGRAETIRGNVRFSGRDFTLEQAAAIFEPSRGALPRLDVAAQTSYQKRSVLSGNAEDIIIEPRGSEFAVFLAIDGELGLNDAGLPSLQLEPTLSSNATVLIGGSERPLSDQEILTLLTLNRLELSNNAEDIAGSVVDTAVDTAVDAFLLAGLQEALSEALNVDLFEIRTSSLSSLVSGEEDTFGVSVRLGTYIADNLFASFRVGSFDDADQAFALSNEFNLRYDFTPFFVEFSGGLNFPSDPARQPVPSFDVTFNYAVSRAISVQTGLGYTSTGTANDVSLRFGVDYRF